MDKVTHYDDKFYDDQADGSLSSALRVVPLVFDKYHPKDIVDVGCGIGTWASVFEKYGCEALGIDGDYVSRDRVLIKKYLPVDISESFKVEYKFDLAVCLEVAEHLPFERSDSFIHDLTQLSDHILFSAATPGQGGTNHINEQPLDFWEKLFNKYGYFMYDEIRPLIAELDDVAWWYKNNIVVFERAQ